MLERIEELESKHELSNASITALMNEFRCLRAHVDLLETRMRVAGLHAGKYAGPDNKKAHDTNASAEDDDPQEKEEEIEHDITWKELQEMDEAHENYTLNPTVWEIPVFVGVPILKHSVSAMICFSLVLTILLQLIMIASINTFGSDFNPNTIVDEFKMWRISEGHNVFNAHPISKASLTSRVCSGDGTLSIGMAQRDMYDSMDSFATTTVGIPRGPLLAIGVLFVWALYIVVEWASIRELMIAFLSVPRDKHTHIEIDGSENCVMKTICPERLAWVLLVSFIRFGITSILGAMGTFWQIRTKSMENLVLNASALAFVILDIPSLMYSVLTPCKAKVLCESLDPLPRKPRQRFHGFEILMLFDIVCISCFVSVCGSLLFVDQGVMTDAFAALCDGEKDFVYGKDNFDRLLVGRTVPSSDAFMVNNSLEVGWIEGIVKKELGVGWYDPHAIQLTMNFPVSSYPDLLNYECADAVQINTLWVNGQDRQLTCPQAKGFCLSSPRIRLLCPQTCECDDPFSGMPFTAPSYGCPRRQCQSTHVYRNALNERNCSDMIASDLAANASWNLLWDNLHTAMTTMSGNPLVFDNIRDTAKTEGCGVFQAQGFERLVMNQFKDRELVNLCDPLAAWCPISCKCNLYKDAYCPTRC